MQDTNTNSDDETNGELLCFRNDSKYMTKID